MGLIDIDRGVMANRDMDHFVVQLLSVATRCHCPILS